MSLHPSIAHLDMPLRIQKLPRDHRGYPVPYFVAWINGQPDHRIADDRKRVVCVQRKRCWLCGDRLGETFAFVIGPMGAVNRRTAEPPSHLACALYAVKACPFLTRPHMIRREAGKPDEAQKPAGEMIARNPGVSLVWRSRKYTRVSDGHGGTLFDIGRCLEALWFCEGRNATRAEILHSFETGIPLLMQTVQNMQELIQLEQAVIEAKKLIPQEQEVARV